MPFSPSEHPCARDPARRVWWSLPKALLLAPLAEFTDAAMRAVLAPYGVDFAVTEMAHARGVREGAPATMRLLETLPGDPPLAAQLYGTEPDDFAGAAVRVESLGRFDAIDINCGCPMPRIRACGAGAALMEDPARVGRIVAAVRASCGLPVTVKTRVGPRPGLVTVHEIAAAARDNGAAALVVHGRYTSQIHHGPLDLAELARAVGTAGLPVAVNGGIRSGADALSLLAATGARAVMAGWGLVGDPWLAEALRRSLDTGVPAERRVPGPDELLRVLRTHWDALRALKERTHDPESGHSVDEELVLTFRTQFIRYFRGIPGSAAFRGRLSGLSTPEALWSAVTDLLDHAKKDSDDHPTH